MIRDASLPGGYKTDLLIRVEEMIESEVHIVEDLPQDFLTHLVAENAEIHWSGSKDGHIDVRMTREGDLVLLRGQISMPIKHPCVRCWQDVHFDGEMKLALRLLAAKEEKHDERHADRHADKHTDKHADKHTDKATDKNAGKRDVKSHKKGKAYEDDEEFNFDEEGYASSNDIDDEDIIAFNNGKIDVLEVLREQLFLQMPLHPSCESDGAHTDEPCQFATTQAAALAEAARWVDPRWEALRAMKESMQEDGDEHSQKKGKS